MLLLTVLLMILFAIIVSLDVSFLFEMTIHNVLDRSALQTPEATHEQNWVRLSLLAYNQLWVARHLGQSMPLPWQRYLPSSSPVTASPAQVQRDFTRIIQQFGTFTRPPKPRGFSPGRLSGHSLTPRPFRPLVKFHPSRRFCPCKSQDNSS